MKLIIFVFVVGFYLVVSLFTECISDFDSRLVLCVPGIVAFVKCRICAGKQEYEPENTCPSQDVVLGP